MTALSSDGVLLAGGEPASESLALEIRGLNKTFGTAQVLHNIDLKVEHGSVHALLGANGSGKSTIIKCLAGVYRPDSGGEIRLNGVALPSTYPPSQAHTFGMTFVHQDLGLLPRLSLSDNLGLTNGFPRRLSMLTDRRELRNRALALMAQVSLDLDPDGLVEDLSSTQKTLLAIARAIGSSAANTSCLILDEPTASLPGSDAEILFDAVRSISSRGVAVVYVSHRMEEIFDLCDRVTVLSDGRVTANGSMGSFTRRELIDVIVGEALGASIASKPAAQAETVDHSDTVLEVKNLSGSKVKDVSFDIGRGEVVGIAGLAGSGRSELARLVACSQRASGGQVNLEGRPLRSLKGAIRAGVGYVPEDRRAEGCILTMPVSSNLTLPSLRELTTWRVLNKSRERKLVTSLMGRFAVRPDVPTMPMSTLSGGNQQKVVLAKWMHRQPRLLVLDEPVQGIDVGARHEIQQHLRDAGSRGAAVLVIDSEFENLLELCHRVLVLDRGRVTHDLPVGELSLTSLVSAVFDVESDAHKPAGDSRTALTATPEDKQDPS